MTKYITISILLMSCATEVYGSEEEPTSESSGECLEPDPATTEIVEYVVEQWIRVVGDLTLYCYDRAHTMSVFIKDETYMMTGTQIVWGKYIDTACPEAWVLDRIRPVSTVWFRVVAHETVHLLEKCAFGHTNNDHSNMDLWYEGVAHDSVLYDLANVAQEFGYSHDPTQFFFNSTKSGQ